MVTWQILAVTGFGFVFYAGMIWFKKTVIVKKLGKNGCPQERLICQKWLEPCKTVQPTRLKPSVMSSKVRKIVEQRILTNLAISRARASVRAARREKARREAERVNVELEKETDCSEPDNPKASKGLRRPPNPLLVYRNYLERCKTASQTKIKLCCQETTSQSPTYPTAEPGSSSVSNERSVTRVRQSMKNHEDGGMKEVSTGKFASDDSLPDSCRKLGSTGTTKCALKMKDYSKKTEKSLNKETESNDDCTQIDQSGISKQSHRNDDDMFKKPFPVKQKAPRHKKTVKEVGKEKVKARNGRCEVVKKMLAAGKKFPASVCVHPSAVAVHRWNVAAIAKLISEEGQLQKKKPNVRKRQAGKSADLLKTLHDIVRLICEQVNYTLQYQG
jgi:hypothetical protein